MIGFEACTIVQVAPELRSRTVTMNGLSKAYAMTAGGSASRPRDVVDQGTDEASGAEHQQCMFHCPGGRGRPP